MGSPITNMLLAQAAPARSGISDDTLSGLTPEAQAAIRALNIQPEATMPSPAPTPAPAAAQPGVMGRIGQFLMSLLPSTQSLAPQGQPTPAPPTPEQLAERNRRITGQ